MESNSSLNYNYSSSIDNLFSLVNATLFDPILYNSPFYFDSFQSAENSNLTVVCETECNINKNDKAITFSIKCDSKLINCLYDTGASRNFMRKNVLNDLVDIGVRLNMRKLPVPLKVRLGDGHIKFISHCVTIEFTISNHVLTDDFFILEELPFEAIIGMDFIMKYNATFNPALKTISFDSDIFSNNIRDDAFLYLTSDVHLPPFCETMVSTKSNTKFEGKGFVSSSEFLSERKSVFVGQGIISYNPKFLNIVISNLSSKAISLPMGINNKDLI